MPKTFLAFIPYGGCFDRPIAVSTTRAKARILGAKWCNEHLDNGGIPVTSREVPLMEVDSEAGTMTEIAALE